jgi:fluoroquinolone resistance protein
MKLNYIADQKLGNISFRVKPLLKGEYENCQFNDCDFSECDLSDCVFTDCEFSYCNLSLVRLTGTTFRDVKFLNCKMLGLHFDDCNEFGVSFSFENCTLDHSSFYKLKIIKTVFSRTKLQ